MAESEFPSNSHKRVRTEEVRTKTTEKKVIEPTKVERVVTNDVIVRKKGLGKRFTETFIGGDARNVWEYVVLDVLIPAARDMIVDAGQEALHRMVYGEGRGGSGRRSRSRYDSPFGGGVNYQSRYDSSNRNSGARREERSGNRRARYNQDMDEIIVESRAEAYEVLDQMQILIDKYDVCRLSEFYEMVGVTGRFTDEKFGWTDLGDARPVHTRNGYALNLPRPVEL